jgi:hypothetical protein
LTFSDVEDKGKDVVDTVSDVLAVGSSGSQAFEGAKWMKASAALAGGSAVMAITSFAVRVFLL